MHTSTLICHLSALSSKAHKVCVLCIDLRILHLCVDVGVVCGRHDSPLLHTCSYECSPCISCVSLRYPRSLLVDPTPSSWEEAWPAVDGGGDQTCPTEQRYTNCQLVRPLLVTTLSYNYTIQCIVPHSHSVSVHCVAPCISVCCHTPIYIYTHIHQGFSRKPARCNCGLCCCSSLACKVLCKTSSSHFHLSQCHNLSTPLPPHYS